jgi:transcriptional regulator with GAF, ATPase, and Fis domain
MQTADSLQTLGVAQARRGEHKGALETLKQAASAADQAGDQQQAGKIFLILIEELNAFLPADQLKNFYAQADRRLAEDASRETLQRLRTCARLLLGGQQPPALTAEGTPRIQFAEEVRKCESALIKRALDEANGSVTRAARILGLTHQGLCYIINHRHQSLLTARAPIRVRRKSLIKKKQ